MRESVEYVQTCAIHPPGMVCDSSCPGWLHLAQVRAADEVQVPADEVQIPAGDES